MILGLAAVETVTISVSAGAIVAALASGVSAIYQIRRNPDSTRVSEEALRVAQDAIKQQAQIQRRLDLCEQRDSVRKLKLTELEELIHQSLHED